ncbi:MAG: lipoyl(octanoyl) transferase LipB [Bacteroidota bacterium]
MNLKINKKVEVLELGLIDYKEAWDYQEKLFKETVDLKIENRKVSKSYQKETKNKIIFCEHPHVFTLGKSGDKENLLADEIKLRQIKAKFYRINRGGDITYHGPGQLVMYPIIDLENFFTDIHKYLRLLEEAVIESLKHFGIESGRIEGLTGVWIDHIKKENPRKICAMGVKTSRWVTMHGIALNVNTDLSYFDQIIPCGIDGKAVTSIEQELGRKIEVKEIQNLLLKQVAKHFEMQILE